MTFHPLPSSAWADGKLAEVAGGHDGGTSQIKVIPTQVRQQMPLPVDITEPLRGRNYSSGEEVNNGQGVPRLVLQTSHHARTVV